MLYLHDDALVVTLLVANYMTRCILIDNGSSADILFWEAFTKMGIDAAKPIPSSTSLKGFSRDVIQLVGVMTLSVIVGMGMRTTTTMIDFLVMKAPSSYNAILRWPMLNNLKAVTSTYHFKMKFPTDSGVGEAQGK